MTVSRTVAIVTANFGRGVSVDEFRANVDRVAERVPGKHIFYGFQEIDEADGPNELGYLREVFGDTHRFIGTKTRVPILVPKTFDINRRIVKHASEGVPGLSPQRQIVQGIVHPVGEPDAKVMPTNTHFGRNIPRLAVPRDAAEEVLRRRLSTPYAGWLTADLNSRNFPRLAPGEKRFADKHLDYIRGYPRQGVSMRRLNLGTINLTIDGHDAHWARVRITWS